MLSSGAGADGTAACLRQGRSGPGPSRGTQWEEQV